MSQKTAQQGRLAIREEPFVNAHKILAANTWPQLGEYRYEVALVTREDSERPTLVVVKRLYNERVGAAWVAVPAEEVQSLHLECFRTWAQSWFKAWGMEPQMMIYADLEFTQNLLGEKASGDDAVFQELRKQHCPELVPAHS